MARRCTSVYLLNAADSIILRITVHENVPGYLEVTIIRDIENRN